MSEGCTGCTACSPLVRAVREVDPGRTTVEVDCFFCGTHVVLSGPGGSPLGIFGRCAGCGRHLAGSPGPSRHGRNNLLWKYVIHCLDGQDWRTRFVFFGHKEFTGVWEIEAEEA